jgi:hypothetical protein
MNHPEGFEIRTTPESATARLVGVQDRAPTWKDLVARWCIERDDLSGHGVSLRDGELHIRLERNGRYIEWHIPLLSLWYHGDTDKILIDSLQHMLRGLDDPPTQRT